MEEDEGNHDMRATIKRMWVNQPSTLQPYHQFHGRRVLADLSDKTFEHSVSVYWLEGPVENQQMLKSSLSDGWPEPNPRKNDQETVRERE